MGRVLLLGIASVLAITGGGCATSANMQEKNRQKPYGDFLMAPTESFGDDKPGETSDILSWAMWLENKQSNLFWDTITWPYALWICRDNGQPIKEQRE
ncbi:MAG TPA: hypothetical protein VH682_03830 [Gemmataceae bacterium]|jgi:hypothetical protein